MLVQLLLVCLRIKVIVLTSKETTYILGDSSAALCCLPYCKQVFLKWISYFLTELFHLRRGKTPKELGLRTFFYCRTETQAPVLGLIATL